MAEKKAARKPVEEPPVEEAAPETYVTAELADEGPLVHISSADAQRFLDEDGKPKEK